MSLLCAFLALSLGRQSAFVLKLKLVRCVFGSLRWSIWPKRSDCKFECSHGAGHGKDRCDELEPARDPEKKMVSVAIECL